MNVTEKTLTSYELHHSGTIFVRTETQLMDNAGKPVGGAIVHRVPYQPVQRHQEKERGPVVAVDTDLSTHPDKILGHLGGLWWVPEVRQAHRARIEAAIAGELEDAKKAAAGARR